MKATFNSPGRFWGALAAGLWVAVTTARTFAAPSSDSPFAADALARYDAARLHYQAEAENPTNAANLACACYDAIAFATNDAERVRLAREGMAACRQSITNQPLCAATHYYLAMDMGQLAQTEIFSALTLVREMEREFKTAAELDPLLDFGGPERNLGLLYLEAPRLTSIGNRHKAREFLEKAAKLAPDYPENHLNLAEACLKWDALDEARRELDLLAACWPSARTRFTGEAWAESWDDWTRRRAADKKTLDKLLLERETRSY